MELSIFSSFYSHSLPFSGYFQSLLRSGGQPGRRSYSCLSRDGEGRRHLCIIRCRWCFCVVWLIHLDVCRQYPGEIDIKYFWLLLLLNKVVKSANVLGKYFLFIIGPAQLGWRPFTLLKITRPCRAMSAHFRKACQLARHSIASHSTVGVYTSKIISAVPCWHAFICQCRCGISVRL